MMKYLPLLLTLALLLGLCAGCGAKKPASASDVSLFDVVCSADEALEKAKEAGIPVMEDLRCTAGQDAMEAFYKAVSKGKSAGLVCLMYYTLDPAHVSAELYEKEKDQYPQAFFTLTEYDGTKYAVTTRKSDEAKPELQDTFPYLLHLTGETLSQTAYDAYVLSDDPTVTLERIWAAGLSSDSRIAFGTRTYTVFMNYDKEGTP